jgi:hypothetical protein
MPGVQAFSFPSNESFARHQFPLGVGGGGARASLPPTLRSRSATLPRFVPMVCAVEPSSLQGSARHLTQTIKEQIKLEGKSVRK